jgi:lipid-A-disaccharide synthase
MKKVFVITGEHSGDIHAGKVVQILKEQNPELEVQGIGGENLKNAGATLFCDHSKMSGFGLNFKMIVDHLALETDVCEYILDEFKPDLVLLIDYGTFNLRVAKRLKGKGIKVFHYIPPQVWASRKWRIKGIKKYIDKVLCIFPFEVEMYKKEGIDVHYCGHPLVKQLPEKANKESFFAKYGLDTNRPLISIFPGSRPLELHFLANYILRKFPILFLQHFAG